MEQNPISRLLRKILFLQRLLFILQVLVIAGAGYLFWKLLGAIQDHYLWSAPLLFVISVAAVLFFLLARSLAWILSRNDRGNAQQTDRLYGLKERLSTYVELRNSVHPFLEPLIHETEPRLAGVSARRISTVASGWIVPVLFVLLASCGLLILPHLPVPDEVIAKKIEQRRIAERGKELEQYVRQLEKRAARAPEWKSLSQELKKLSQELQKPDLKPAEAYKKLNALQDKLNREHSTTQQKLSEDLKKAWQEASKADGADGKFSDQERKLMEQLAKDFQQALEGKDPAAGEFKNNPGEQGQFNPQDLKNLKEALKQYQEQKSRSEKMRAEMQQALEKAKKGAAPGKEQFTTDSRVKDREVERGKGGVEDGPGTTNVDAGPSRFDTNKKEAGTYVEDRTRADYEKMYEGERIEAGKDPVYLGSRWSEEGDPQYTNVRDFGVQKDVASQAGNSSLAPQNQDESAIRKERIPASHQKMVKEYFEAIEE